MWGLLDRRLITQQILLEKYIILIYKIINIFAKYILSLLLTTRSFAVNWKHRLPKWGIELGYLSKLMTRPVFSQFWLAKNVSTRLTVCCFIYKKTVDFLRTSIYYFWFAFNQVKNKTKISKIDFACIFWEFDILCIS